MAATTGLTPDPVRELRTSIRGDVIEPVDAEYRAARRLWNGMIDRRPSVIARCSGTADVVRAIAFAREHALPIAVRGGGHGVAGRATCDDGLVIDLSPMRGIRIDPAARTVRAQGGVLWGELDRETQLFGLATTGGAVSTTGIAGLTVTGGFGWLMRRHGMVIDNLVSVDLVTADGTCLTVSEDEHADLFWGMRGAGANFGVVTSFEYRLHPVGPIVLGGMVVHPLENATAALRFYREFSGTAPDEVGSHAGMLTTPDGMKVLALAAAYFGPVDDGERALEPLRSFGPPVADLVAPTPYVTHQTLFDASFPAARRDYEKSTFIDALDDAAIDALVEHMEGVPSPYSLIIIEHHGGALRRVPEDATAFRHRAPEYNVTVPGGWEDPSADDENIAWVRDVVHALAPVSTGTYYANYQAELDRDERVEAAWGANYERLATLKVAYDPANVFRFNHNVTPAA
ncbi:MAG TPA: FAD-binding oxidoreductase [Solirubrobacteraceae bacterium]|nr:FAD-binding oxidoreductase [Solirubrobacteraceae bacterium]